MSAEDSDRKSPRDLGLPSLSDAENGGETLAERLDTVIVAGALEYLPEDSSSQLLSALWKRLTPDGPMVVS